MTCVLDINSDVSMTQEGREVVQKIFQPHMNLKFETSQKVLGS